MLSRRDQLEVQADDRPSRTTENGVIGLVHSADPHMEGRVSVVVPTRNEAGNVQELVRQLQALPGEIVAEVLFVDDSDDETPEVIRAAAGTASFPVRLLHREPGDRAGGLSSAVIAGWRNARATWVCVMDGDLQHPPSVIAELLRAAGDGDLAYATRYDNGTAEEGLGPVRSFLSHASTVAARLLFPRRLRDISDPMSGFFLVRRTGVDLDKLRPNGFKILLDVIARSPRLKSAGVPFAFGPRHAGRSKASPREAMRYARHLVRLRTATMRPANSTLATVTRFAAVGISGVGINQLAMWLLVSQANLNYIVAALLATQASTTWNFALADRFVFKAAEGSRRARFLGFLAANNALNVFVAVPLLALLVSGLGVNYLIANPVVLAMVFAGRYLFSDRVLWGARPGSRRATGLRYRYDIAHLVTVASEVELRELKTFRVTATAEPADIELRRGVVGSRLPRRHLEVELAAGAVSYKEHLGGWASNFSVDLNGPIKVVVGPLLATSPHVVYTNVIEALLRFVLVSRGYMLLHSATLELDSCGVMLSARTDTGKTGTILRLTREKGAAFLSDDMTILGSDGVARSYPKPLTISSHTVRAVNKSALNRREWALLLLQSKVHSKSGRGIGAWLAERNLPIMSFNSTIQKIIPPPKYTIDRLVPCTTIASTRVSELFIIERGAPSVGDIDLDQALDELIENTDDAYGFPPFNHFAPAIAIGDDGYLTLRAKERAILARALNGIRVRRLASDNFSWADDIPALLAADAEARADELAAQMAPRSAG